DGVCLGETHFNPARSVSSAPIALASYIAARTERVRIGTAVQVLPLGIARRIAEDVATVDHLSRGRFDFGIGRSGSPRAYDALGIPYAESQARFEESLRIILEAWKGEPFSYDGNFYRIKNATVGPRPYQRPHPPLRMAANSRETRLRRSHREGRRRGPAREHPLLLSPSRRADTVGTRAWRHGAGRSASGPGRRAHEPHV